MKELKDYLLDQIKGMRDIKRTQYAKPQDHVMNLVTRFIHDQSEYTIKSDNMPARGKRTYKIFVSAQRYPATVRIATTSNSVRILMQDFQSWVYERQGATITHVMKELVDMGAVKIRASIDAGSGRDLGGRQTCIDFPLSVPAFKKSLGSFTS